MVASEFGFLALGLIVGIPVGAVLLVMLRRRPRPSREVRVTVTPDSVPRRRSTTLATDPFSAGKDSARGGPADTAWNSDQATPPARATPRRSPVMASDASIMIAASPGEPPARDASRWPPVGTPVRSSVGVAVGRGADPVLAAIKGNAAGEPVAVGVLAGGSAADAEKLVESASIDRLRSVIADDSSRRRAAIDLGRATAMATRAQPMTAPVIAHSPVAMASASGSVSTSGDSGSTGASASGQGAASDGGSMPQAHAEDTSVSATTADNGTGGGSAETAGGDKPEARPCDEQRHVVDERCALADRMKTLAEQAATRLRETQREYDVHVSRGDEAAAVSDPRAQRAAKDAAQRSFRSNRASARTREAVEAAARTWLLEINRINAEAREATNRLATERATIAPLLAEIERLTVQADSARVQAESAQESCVMAREALAVCEESLRATPGRMPLEPSLAPGEMPSGRPIPSWAEAVTPILGAPVLPEVDEGGLLEASTLGGQPAIFRLLAGDHVAMQRIVAEVAGEDPEERRRWQLLLADFVDAVVARAIEACAFGFPAEQQFWAPFSRDQARDIALALSSLGYRFDGLGGFAEERIPSQRDLSLALGYAGLDPMRVRRWPNETEMGNLFAEVTVSADEYLAGAASGLTLGELVSLLGPRADPLTDLWNAWGQVRPLLLEPSEWFQHPPG